MPRSATALWSASMALESELRLQGMGSLPSQLLRDELESKECREKVKGKMARDAKQRMAEEILKQSLDNISNAEVPTCGPGPFRGLDCWKGESFESGHALQVRSKSDDIELLLLNIADITPTRLTIGVLHGASDWKEAKNESGYPPSRLFPTALCGYMQELGGEDKVVTRCLEQFGTLWEMVPCGSSLASSKGGLGSRSKVQWQQEWQFLERGVCLVALKCLEYNFATKQTPRRRAQNHFCARGLDPIKITHADLVTEVHAESQNSHLLGHETRNQSDALSSTASAAVRSALSDTATAPHQMYLGDSLHLTADFEEARIWEVEVVSRSGCHTTRHTSPDVPTPMTRRVRTLHEEMDVAFEQHLSKSTVFLKFWDRCGRCLCYDRGTCEVRLDYPKHGAAPSHVGGCASNTDGPPANSNDCIQTVWECTLENANDTHARILSSVDMLTGPALAQTGVL